MPILTLVRSRRFAELGGRSFWSSTWRTKAVGVVLVRRRSAIPSPDRKQARLSVGRGVPCVPSANTSSAASVPLGKVEAHASMVQTTTERDVRADVRRRPRTCARGRIRRLHRHAGIAGGRSRSGGLERGQARHVTGATNAQAPSRSRSGEHGESRAARARGPAARRERRRGRPGNRPAGRRDERHARVPAELRRRRQRLRRAPSGHAGRRGAEPLRPVGQPPVRDLQQARPAADGPHAGQHALAGLRPPTAGS